MNDFLVPAEMQELPSTLRTHLCRGAYLSSSVFFPLISKETVQINISGLKFLIVQV